MNCIYCGEGNEEVCESCQRAGFENYLRQESDYVVSKMLESYPIETSETAKEFTYRLDDIFPEDLYLGEPEDYEK